MANARGKLNDLKKRSILSDREKQIEQLKTLMKAFADTLSDDEVIYHYTSAEGLRGIIESNEIWLTNTAFVNDTTEGKILQKSANLFGDTDFSNSYVEAKWKTFIRWPSEDNNHYMISFSRKRNSLEQWRAYGSFCIGFEAKKLVNQSFNLYEGVYSDQEIKDWILQKEKIAEWQGGLLDDKLKDAAAFHLIYAASRKRKSDYYKEEKEVRLIAVSNHTWGFYHNSPSMFEKDPPIHFRVHSVYKVPVPYVKFFISKDEGKENKQESVKETFIQMQERKLGEEKNKKREQLPIKEILIGPMQHQEGAKVGCKVLLEAKGYKNVDLNISDIPYRGF